MVYFLYMYHEILHAMCLVAMFAISTGNGMDGSAMATELHEQSRGLSELLEVQFFQKWHSSITKFKQSLPYNFKVDSVHLNGMILVCQFCTVLASSRTISLSTS